MLEQGGWEVLSLPAIAVEDEEHRICTPYATYDHVRKTGEALHPQRDSPAVLAGMRAIELPTSGFEIVQSWDTASKESELASYSVCTTWLVHKQRH